ncbi:hypothetical protein ACWJJH_12715 [Endozoicomonadaceae bacterium StTr2]
MTISPDLIPGSWQWFFVCCAAIALLVAIRNFPFSSIFTVSTRQHLILGSIIFLFCLWTLGVKLENEVLRLHFIGLTAVVMLIGWSPAVVSGLIALCLLNLTSASDWDAFTINFFFCVLIPATVTKLTLLTVSQIKLNNLFIYMLGGGFFGAGLVRIVMAGAFYVLAMLSAPDSALVAAAEQYLPYMLLAAFPEGFINGTLASAMTVFFPDWVRSYDEHRYIERGD